MNTAIESITYSKSFFKPGEAAQVSLVVSSAGAQPVTLLAEFRSLAQTVGQVRQTLDLPQGQSRLSFSWQPPAGAPAGYGLDVTLQTAGGAPLAHASSAFDVLERWTQNPRYGFLTDFTPGRDNAAETMASLAGYHINALQFYDWMYHHDQFLVDYDPYTDLFGRVHSLQTVKALIQAAHGRNIAAMPYTAVYGASYQFFKDHPEMDLYNADGTPHVFIEGLMGYMDNRPGSPWTQHLLGQFDEILRKTAFDGIHLDQYGDPKTGYDAQGNAFDLAQPMADMINATADLVAKQRGADGAVVFNAVTAWPLDVVAPAREDVVYIEVWAPYTAFANLRQLILQAQNLGSHKPVVLAAYIDPALEANARIMDAIIFASGAGHIELGEQNGYLADPYFPKYGVMSPRLQAALRSYIELSIRYQGVFGPAAADVTAAYQDRILLAGVNTAPEQKFDKVWPILREGGQFTALSLVNMLGIGQGDWAVPVVKPTPLAATPVQISGLSRAVKQVWFASPDAGDLALRPLAFQQAGGALHFEIPGLEYWDLVLIEWGS
jgi:dextranase